MRRSLLISLALVSMAASAIAQEGPPPGEEEAPGPAQPVGVAPTDVPPSPEANPPPPPDAPAAVAITETAPAPVAQTAGQWVYTQQFGWLYEPYSQQYTYVPADGQTYPSQYVYYPVYGWRWVVAPWVYGYGPQPYWGAWGPRYYTWYAHPWYHVGGYYGWGGYHGWGQYHGWVGPHSWGAHGWVGAPSYYREGYHGQQGGGFHEGAHAGGVEPHRADGFRGEPHRVEGPGAERPIERAPEHEAAPQRPIERAPEHAAPHALSPAPRPAAPKPHVNPAPVPKRPAAPHPAPRKKR